MFCLSASVLEDFFEHIERFLPVLATPDNFVGPGVHSRVVVQIAITRLLLHRIDDRPGARGGDGVARQVQLQVHGCLADDESKIVIILWRVRVEGAGAVLVVVFDRLAHPDLDAVGFGSLDRRATPIDGIATYGTVWVGVALAFVESALVGGTFYGLEVVAGLFAVRAHWRVGSLKVEVLVAVGALRTSCFVRADARSQIIASERVGSLCDVHSADDTCAHRSDEDKTMVHGS